MFHYSKREVICVIRKVLRKTLGTTRVPVFEDKGDLKLFFERNAVFETYKVSQRVFSNENDFSLIYLTGTDLTELEKKLERCDTERIIL